MKIQMKKKKRKNPINLSANKWSLFLNDHYHYYIRSTDYQ